MSRILLEEYYSKRKEKLRVSYLTVGYFEVPFKI